MDQIIGNISLLAAAPIFNLGLLIDGLLIGSIFALAAYGLALVWGVMNVKNLAQGDFIMIGGYLTWTLGSHGIHPLFGVPVAFVVLWGIGWVLYRTVISKVIARDLFTSLLATFGIAIVIQQGLNLAFGPDTQSAHADLPTWEFAGGLITVTATRVIGFVFAAILAVAVILFMKKQPHGPGHPRDGAGCARGPRARHRHGEGLFVHLQPQCRDLRGRRRPRRRGLECAAVPGHDLFDPPVRHRDGGGLRQPAGRDRRRLRDGRVRAVRRLCFRRPVPAGAHCAAAC